MSEAPVFRNYRFCQETDGQAFELSRSPAEVECLAFDTFLRRFVSFHVLTGENPDREAFRGNLEVLRRLDIPCLAQVVDGGDDEGTLFYVTRLIDGPTLQGYLGNLDRVGGGMAALLVHQISSVLLRMDERMQFLFPLEPRSFRLVTVEGNRLGIFLTSLRIAPDQPSPDHPGDTDTRPAPAAVAEATWALLGLVAGHGEPTPGQEQPTLSGKEVRTHLATILAAAREDALGALEELRQAIARNHRNPDAFTVDPASRPGRLLLRETPSPDMLRAQLAGSPEPLPSTGAGSLGYAYLTRDPPPGIREPRGRLALQVFPPGRLLPPETVNVPVSRGDRPSDDPTLPVVAKWQVDEAPVLGELAVNGFDLETALAARDHFSPAETLTLLEAARSAIARSEAGHQPAPPRLLPRDLFLHFDLQFPSRETREALLVTPLDQLPPHRILVRVLPTMDALTDGWSHCPSPPRPGESPADPINTDRQADTLSKWCSELLICLAGRLLGLPRPPAGTEPRDADLPAPLRDLLAEALPGLHPGSEALPMDSFLARFREAVVREAATPGTGTPPAPEPAPAPEPEPEPAPAAEPTPEPEPEPEPEAADDLFAPPVEKKAPREEQLGFAQVLFQDEPLRTDADTEPAEPEQLLAGEPEPDEEPEPGFGASLAGTTVEDAPAADQDQAPNPSPFVGPPPASLEPPRPAAAQDQGDLAKLIIASQRRRHIGENLLWILILAGIASGFFYILARQGIIPENLNPFRDDPPPEARETPGDQPAPDAAPGADTDTDTDTEAEPGKVLRALRFDESLHRQAPRPEGRPQPPAPGPPSPSLRPPPAPVGELGEEN